MPQHKGSSTWLLFVLMCFASLQIAHGVRNAEISSNTLEWLGGAITAKARKGMVGRQLAAANSPAAIRNAPLAGVGSSTARQRLLVQQQHPYSAGLVAADGWGQQPQVVSAPSQPTLQQMAAVGAADLSDQWQLSGVTAVQQRSYEQLSSTGARITAEAAVSTASAARPISAKFTSGLPAAGQVSSNLSTWDVSMLGGAAQPGAVSLSSGAAADMQLSCCVPVSQGTQQPNTPSTENAAVNQQQQASTAMTTEQPTLQLLNAMSAGEGNWVLTTQTGSTANLATTAPAESSAVAAGETQPTHWSLQQAGGNRHVTGTTAIAAEVQLPNLPPSPVAAGMQPRVLAVSAANATTATRQAQAPPTASNAGQAAQKADPTATAIAEAAKPNSATAAKAPAKPVNSTAAKPVNGTAAAAALKLGNNITAAKALAKLGTTNSGSSEAGPGANARIAIATAASAKRAAYDPTGNDTVDDDYCENNPNNPACSTEEQDAELQQSGSPTSAHPAPNATVAALSVPLHYKPKSSFDSIVEVNLDTMLLQIPQSFMGISHEWTHVEEINNIPGYKDIITLLTSYGSGPFIIRVGGGSTDKQAYVFPQYVYEALKQVHYDTGSQFILGLNFEKGDVELARSQMKMAKDNMPAESIITFEVGNEPNFYEGTQDGMTALQYVRCCFVPDWEQFAQSLTCPCGDWNCCGYGQFAGPVWGHINVYPTTIKWFLDVNHKYVEMTTIHWYKAQKEVYNTPATLLEEGPIRKEMDNLKQLVQVSNSFGKPLRVAEMNTISNSGRVGVSNVFSAALWTLDGAFEVAATGAVGVNLHQGSGQNLYTSILRWYNSTGQLAAPVLRPPFYGMLLFQQAVRGGSKLLNKYQISGDGNNFKVWPLLDANDQELRFVIVNKHPNQAGTQTIRINRSWGYGTSANVTRLVARGEDPLSATSGITIGGYYYAIGGEKRGTDKSFLAPLQKVDGLQAWKIYMPPGSAALVRVKKVDA